VAARCQQVPATRRTPSTSARANATTSSGRPASRLLHCHINHHTTNDNVEQQGGGGLMLIRNVTS